MFVSRAVGEKEKAIRLVCVERDSRPVVSTARDEPRIMRSNASTNRSVQKDRCYCKIELRDQHKCAGPSTQGDRLSERSNPIGSLWTTSTLKEGKRQWSHRHRRLQCSARTATPRMSMKKWLCCCALCSSLNAFAHQLQSFRIWLDDSCATSSSPTFARLAPARIDQTQFRQSRIDTS